MKRSLRSWVWRVPVEQEIDEEISLHVELRTRELIDRGVDPGTARELALSRFGNVADLKRTCIDLGKKRDRDMRVTQWIGEVHDDVTFAVRQLKAAPAFALVAILTLALGIGANSAIFALVDAVLLRPLPFPDPDRLVMVWEQTPANARSAVAPANLFDWNQRNRTFERIAGFVPSVGGMVMAGTDGHAETVPRQWVTGGIFDALGISPVAGRTFNASDETPAPSAVVLNERFWRSRYGADPSVIGSQIRLDGEPFTIVGVVPHTAQLLGQASIWAAVPLTRNPPNARVTPMLRTIGRMKAGVDLETANADLGTIANTLALEFPATNRGRGVRLEPMHDSLIGSELRLTSLLFLGVVGFVLLICCANVANLLLARATSRTRELAVRSALGAGRRRIVRQLMTESLLLALLGGALGAGVGAAILNAAPSLIPPGLLPGAVSIAFDGRVVAFCAGAALVVGLLFGIAPAWQATDFSAARGMGAGGRTGTARSGRVRGVLVASQVAAATLLLCGAGLLLRTLLAVAFVDRGYRAESLLTMMVDPLGSEYPTDQSLRQFYEAVEQEVRALPGVRSVAWASTLPMGPASAGPRTFEIVGDPPPDESRRPTADYQIVSPSYFETIDLPLLAGRGFTDRDTGDNVAVCIVNEGFARTHLAGRSPIGVQLLVSAPGTKPQIREIVGVARQVKGRPDETQELTQIYVPNAQNLIDDIFMIVRPAAGPAEALISGVRAAISRVDRNQLVSVRDVVTLDDIAWSATARHRFRAVMVITFAALALLLAMVGVFGILAYSVQQRIREFGVRIALGATLHDVLGVVIGHAARVVAVGTAVGLILAAALGRMLTSVLFGVQPLDPLTYGLVVVVIAATAALATAAPAWRAARIDPAIALRAE
jgi:putative ABC transport system permease protein